MFTDLTDQIKDGIILFLSSSQRFTQFMPAANIYAMQVPANPAYPFFRFGTPIPTPYLASCFAGTSLRATLDIFAEGTAEDPGEVIVGRLTRVLVEEMNNLNLGPGLTLLDNSYLGARRSIVDQEADRWRSMVEYSITAVLTA